MSPRLRAALYAQAGAVFSLHPCLYAGDRPTAGRSRFATLLPGDAAVSPSNGDHAGTQRADPPPPRNGPKHRGAGRSRSATGPPRQSRSTRQFFCAEVLAGIGTLTPQSFTESIYPLRKGLQRRLRQGWNRERALLERTIDDLRNRLEATEEERRTILRQLTALLADQRAAADPAPAATLEPQQAPARRGVFGGLFS